MSPFFVLALAEYRYFVYSNLDVQVHEAVYLKQEDDSLYSRLSDDSHSIYCQSYFPLYVDNKLRGHKRIVYTASNP
jgi:hypothetical protein